MKIRLAAFTLASVAAMSLSGCMAIAARSDPTVSDHFQPMIGARGSLHMIGQTAQMGILRIDEDRARVSLTDGGLSLVMMTFFAADLPATAVVDLINLPLDVATELGKLTAEKDDSSQAVTELDEPAD
ncbi:MAG: hypothetical protein O2820_21820 [Planctomycetota bacterium]|nr:hypothetical protein [Planctomycetota bacterium]